MDFLPLMQPERNLKKRRLEGDSESEVSEKEDNEYEDFKRFGAASQKIWQSIYLRKELAAKR